MSAQIFLIPLSEPKLNSNYLVVVSITQLIVRVAWRMHSPSNEYILVHRTIHKFWILASSFK